MHRPRILIISNTPAALERANHALSGRGRGSEDPVRHDPARTDPAFDVLSCGSVQAACREVSLAPPDVAVLLLRDRTPAQCLDACFSLQEVLAPHGVPLAVIFPSTDPGVWQRIYASGANMFLPWHGEVIEGLPTYVASLLSHWGRGRPDTPDGDAAGGRAHRIELDERRRSARIKNWHANFTPVQFRILHYLVENKGRLVSKEELANFLTAPHRLTQVHVTTSLYQHISQIRKKLGPYAAIVRCVRSRGYLLDISFLAG